MIWNLWLKAKTQQQKAQYGRLETERTKVNDLRQTD